MSVYKFSFYAAAVLIAVGALLLFSDSPQSILGQVELESEQSTVAYAVARDTETQYFNEDGSLSYIFKAKKLSHFRPSELEEQSYSTASKPEIDFLDDKTPWRVTAEQALVDHNRIITLNTDVRLINTDQQGAVSEMLTEVLTLEPEQKLAYTEEPVTINSSLGHMSAIGMQADLNTRRITLLSKVKGVHKPETLTP
ncbi:LPS export ABC transporter periplasmic protein LptC [Agaribacterium haliotis]|uniref:LPS export ABC transporter periplasmic protein LptC n=1 Tax=Agaribacterium haliotis TaxID=2013869 RepID=UPI000BB58B72|nr:LPS export ABC transporter periplasmic protein LptC [Agaribacterium haliotis]